MNSMSRLSPEWVVRAQRAAHSRVVIRSASVSRVGRGLPSSARSGQATVSAQAPWVTATEYSKPNLRLSTSGTAISRPSMIASARP